MRYHWLLYLILMLLPFSPSAQLSVWEVGALTGGACYSGDLVSPANALSESLLPAFGVFARKQIHPSWRLRVQLLNGVLTGDDRHHLSDPARQERLFSFSTDFLEIALLGEWHFRGNASYQPAFSPFIFGGLGLVIIDPGPDFSKTKDVALLERVALDQRADFNRIMPILPFGVGAVWKVHPNFRLGATVGIRPTFTDYLDGISKAGNPNTNDWYGFMGLSLGYQFGRPDRDRDGIADVDDRCPDVAGLKAMDGCPDADQDGITDQADDCPFAAGTPLFYGCPDTDGDGIPDKSDRCPDEVGEAERGGCPFRDRDLDGVEDEDDLCPDMAGPPEREGCPIVDSDQDGILDEDDRCPYQFGLPIFGGCPDTDGDGIEDARDACPQLFGIYINDGCPLVLSADEEALEINRQYLLFEEKSDEILRYSLLDRIAGFLKKYPDYRLLIKGFAAQEGGQENNKQYAAKRARACYEYLLEQEVRPTQIDFQGYGSQFPLSSEFAKGDVNLNSRVEFELYPPGRRPGNP